MRFAVNYSRAVADLVDTGKITIDAFKCPAWPDVIAAVQATYPCMSISRCVSDRTGDAIDTETRQPADWSEIGTC